MYAPPTNTPFYARHHTIWVKVIISKGQLRKGHIPQTQVHSLGQRLREFVLEDMSFGPLTFKRGAGVEVSLKGTLSALSDSFLSFL